jgi:hypothetical protein
METDTLRLFVLAADKLNISAAGRELGLAPSVASAWMNKLEKSVGADLLHRSTRKVALSTEGLEFLPYARDIVAREDAARAALGQGEARVSGTLRFTAPDTGHRRGYGERQRGTSPRSGGVASAHFTGCHRRHPSTGSPLRRVASRRQAKRGAGVCPAGA